MTNAMPSLVVGDTEPLTPSAWQDLLTSIATADAESYVQVVVFSKAANAPPPKEYSFPAAYFSFIPKFVATVPVEQPPVVLPPPPPALLTLYVVSPTGVSVRSLFGTDQPKVGSLPFGALVVVEQVYTATATGYVWRKIASGSFAGDYVAEKTTDGTTTILSATPPK